MLSKFKKDIQYYIYIIQFHGNIVLRSPNFNFGQYWAEIIDKAFRNNVLETLFVYLFDIWQQSAEFLILCTLEHNIRNSADCCQMSNK